MHIVVEKIRKISIIMYMETLLQLRNRAGMTQSEAAKLFGVSLRSYQDYENVPAKAETIKYKYFTSRFEKMLLIDEEHGVLTIDQIKEICADVFKRYVVRTCVLFGSYSRGEATGKSDVDLLIDADVHGADFFGLCEELRVNLHKVVDLLDLNQVMINKELLQEILKDGIRIYEKH